MSSTILSISPVERLALSGRAPGDPTAAHTALVRAALARSASTIRNLPTGDADLDLLVAAIEHLGCRVELSGRDALVTPPDGGLREPDAPLGLGNAGYAFRLLVGLLSAQPFRSRLDAANPLNRRNIERVLEPLRTIGAELTSTDRGTPPVTVFPARIRSGERVELPIPNAFVKSALVTAARAARVALTITEPEPSRDYAERIFEAGRDLDGRYTVSLDGRDPAPLDWTLPSDTAVTDHLTTLAILRPGFSLSIEGRVDTPFDRRLLELLGSLGATFELRPDADAPSWMPTGRLEVSPARLKGRIELDARTLPGIGAELPLLAVAVGCGGGELEVRGAMDMRQQTCDRISAIVDNLAFFGIDTEELDDGFRVSGGRPVTGGVELSAYDDPVIAAAMIVLCAAADAPSLLFDVPDDPRIAALTGLLGDGVRVATADELEQG